MKQETDEATCDMERCEQEVYCPFCKSVRVKNNGYGYYRCKEISCNKSEFFIAYLLKK